VRVLSGTPTPEVEPNNDLATATPLAGSGWMSGTISATTDPDFFSIASTPATRCTSASTWTPTA
jgi:hypothetical protein